jgi:soluble lytic murein transglycosylase-like protein
MTINVTVNGVLLKKMIDLSTIPARMSFASHYATQYGIDLTLLCSVVMQESSWNTFAIRFEPAFEARYIKPAIPSMPTTLELTKAMSFGLMQIMGETAIEFGWAGEFLSELCDPDVGMEFGCKKLQSCLTRAAGDVNQALLYYNGGSDPTYPSLVLAWEKDYQPIQGETLAT